MVVATCLATAAVLATVLVADVPLADAMQLLAAVASPTRKR
jgi:hypothetical protein